MGFSFYGSDVCRSLSLLIKTCADLVRLNITLLGKHSERAGDFFSLCSSLGSGSTYAFTYLEEKLIYTKKELD